ncbi:hypothetical protein [Paenibacillus naphthalenovorans]|uniref:Uncharacterized protein n=1 Tax=Paenibacillus naphthalenovorans TaxID=162209 RepID=A0A0U2IN23_9BACL|nr:hypothetical protein [Paenibacillus naphthalenovorans]ALS23883.1 hypothetical protein IJ22_35450 [Paenibacillus naphthalenovorans]
MRQIRHINLADENSRVYCCLRNKIVKLDEDQKKGFCASCRMYAGDAGGQGVECVWGDMRPVSDPYVVNNPGAELLSNQKKQIGNTDYLSTCAAFAG